MLHNALRRDLVKWARVVGQRRIDGRVVLYLIAFMFIWVGWGGAITSLALRVLRMLR